jgi:hypothetical protein
MASLADKAFEFTAAAKGRQLIGWLPLYTMVTFRPDISYAAARKRAEVQTRVMTVLGWTMGIVGVAAFMSRIGLKRMSGIFK